MGARHQCSDTSFNCRYVDLYQLGCIFNSNSSLCHWQWKAEHSSFLSAAIPSGPNSWKYSWCPKIRHGIMGHIGKGKMSSSWCSFQYDCHCQKSKHKACHLHCACTEPCGQKIPTGNSWPRGYKSNTSTTAKQRLAEMQEQMQSLIMKLIQEEDTCWNSTFLMLQHLYEERQAVGAALSLLQTDVIPLSSEDYETADGCLKVLSPFFMATVELSKEKRVSGSKVIPLIKMQRCTLHKMLPTITNNTAVQLGQNLAGILNDKFSNLETSSALTLSMLLDPRFKTIGFYNHVQA